MKKVLLPLCVALLGAGLIGCGETTTTTPSTPSTPTEKDYTLNFGSTVSFSTADSGVVTQISVLSFAVVFDADAKVVSSYIDEVQIPLTYADGVVSYNATKTQVSKAGAKNVLSKRELGTAYGSMPAGTFYVQVDAFQEGIVGKTAEEIKALKAGEGDIAGCTMSGTVPSLIATLAVAQEEVHTTTFKTAADPKVGIGMNIAAAGNTITTELAAVVFDGETVLASNFDAYQAPLAEGKLDTSKNQVKNAGAKNLLSKKELGEAYGAMPAGTWLPQANA